MYLKDELVAIRALEPEDVYDLYKWENNPEIWNVSTTLSPYSKFVLSEYITDSINKDVFELQQLRLVVEDLETKIAIGVVDLYDVSARDHHASVGISINEQEYRRQGYATSALRLMTEYSFGILGLHSLHARIDEDNTASRKLFKKCGFQEVGLLRDWHWTASGWKNQVEVQLINI